MFSGSRVRCDDGGRPHLPNGLKCASTPPPPLLSAAVGTRGTFVVGNISGRLIANSGLGRRQNDECGAVVAHKRLLQRRSWSNKGRRGDLRPVGRRMDLIYPWANKWPSLDAARPFGAKGYRWSSSPLLRASLSSPRPSDAISVVERAAKSRDCRCARCSGSI